MAECFEDLRAWQTARKLTNEVYGLTSKRGCEADWTLKDQSRRASTSVMSNIAEGFESSTRPSSSIIWGTPRRQPGGAVSALHRTGSGLSRRRKTRRHI
ncbi:four helix bundle protein [Salinibacter altiplanensis]|uniref:four helix bundle protein n=1 Tax=Salinibacter altiplanensis TaxID=1803181 RepID=UPI000C9FAA8A